MIREEILPLIAKHLQPKVYVELGLGYAGPTLFCRMLEVLSNSECHGIDIVDMRERFAGMQNAFVFCGTTQQFRDKWVEAGGKNIDMIFVDADHDCMAVADDIDMFLPYLTPDTGIMVLHDTWPVAEDWTGPDKSGTAYKVTKMLREDYDDIEVFTLPIHHGLTFIRKVGDNWRNG